MAELTQEDLKNMTPEQIAELQKQNCVFCHIISGKVASKKVYEDEKCVAVLDINPANPGHVLLMPKEHYAIMPVMPEDIVGYLFMVAKGISHACLKAFKAEGTNIFVANGVAAGQKAQHFMIHIIPRKDKDGVTSFALPKKKMPEEQMAELEKALKQRINYVFGIKDKEPIELGKPAEEVKKTTAKEEPKKAEEKEVEAEIVEEKKGGAEEKEEEGKEQEKEEEERDYEEKEEKGDGIDLDKIAELLGGGLGKK